MRYLIVNASSPYNIIIGIPSFNALESSLSVRYLTMKYPLEGGQVEVLKGNHGLARKCYKDSLKLKNNTQQDRPTTQNTLKVNLVDLDHWGDPADDSFTPIGELKKVKISVEDFQVT